MTFCMTFEIPGEPHGKGRPRFRKFGNFVSTYNDKKTQTYEALVKQCAKEAFGDTELLETPISLYLYIRLPIPKSYSKKRSEACLSGLEKPSKKPDIDNVLKSVMDGLNGVIYKDDNQVVNVHMTKVYAKEVGIDVYLKEDLQ